MKPKLLVVALLVLSGFACATRTQPEASDPRDGSPGSASLSVTVLGLKTDEGELALALFDSAESFKARSGAVASGRLSPDDGAATWTVTELDPGIYAVAVYHDLNGNGELDRSTLGPPDEPYGFSNNARGTFGPPRFDKAAIEIAPGERAIEIKLR